jgi:hypothetical protein
LVVRCSSFEEKASSAGQKVTIALHQITPPNFNDQFAKIEYQMTLIESHMGQSVLDFWENHSLVLSRYLSFDQ